MPQLALAVFSALVVLVVSGAAAVMWRRQVARLELRLAAKLHELAALHAHMAETGRQLARSSHDLNNVFGVVIGYASLPSAEVCTNDLTEIAAAARRGADLSKQLPQS